MGNMLRTAKGLALIAMSLAITVACSRETNTSSNQQVRSVPVRTAKVEQMDITEELSLTGTLKPQAQIQVVSEISARLLHLVKDEGAAVSRGELIAVLDATDAQLAHERAAAAVAVAQANREHAVAERDRANNLLRTGGITDQDHLAAQVRLQVAEASLKQAKAEEAIAAQQLSRCQIRAPFSGTVAKRLADAGTMLAVGTPVLNLVDNSVLEFRAAVPSADLSKIRIGAPAQITVDAMPGTTMEGAISRILPTADERSRSFEVVVRVAGRDKLISGLFARARVKVRDIAGAVVVPPPALVVEGSRSGVATVFVVENGKAEAREVSLGVEGLNTVEVRSGLKVGTIVVVDPPTTLASGAAVQVIGTTNSVNR